jgi:hypothetical protein
LGHYGVLLAENSCKTALLIVNYGATLIFAD